MSRIRQRHSSEKNKKRRKGKKKRRVNSRSRKRRGLLRIKAIMRLNALKTRKKIAQRLCLCEILAGILLKNSSRSSWNNLEPLSMLCCVEFKVMKHRHIGAPVLLDSRTKKMQLHFSKFRPVFNRELVKSFKNQISIKKVAELQTQNCLVKPVFLKVS